MSELGTSGRRFTLGRDRRLRGSRTFANVRALGQRRVCGCLIANWHPLDSGKVSRLGIVTSRRIGSSIVRSRARRLMREAFRLHQNEITVPIALILIARASMVGKPLATVSRDLLRCLRDAGLWVPQTLVTPCAASSPASS